MDDREPRTERDFETLPLEQIHDLTGLEPPADPGADEERRYRQKAYESYKLDVAHTDEWGTAREGEVPPANGAKER